MSPNSQEPRHLTVDEAVAAIAHFNPDRPASADKLRRWVREGKLEATRPSGSKRILLTVPDLVMKGLLHPNALEWSGELLPVSVPDSPPSSWSPAPGPLEQQLTGATASPAQAEDDGLDDQAFDDGPADDLAEPEYDEAPDFGDDDGDSAGDPEDSPTDVFGDATDEDLAPARPPAAGLAGPAVRAKRTPREPRPPRTRRQTPRRPAHPVRALAVAASLLVVAVIAGIAWTSSDGGKDPAKAVASRTPVNPKLTDEMRAQQSATNAMRATMEAAAASGDFKLAITRAQQLSDATSVERYKLAAATVLVRRASKAAERGDLDRARGLVQRSRRYANTPGAEQVNRRADAIEQARKAREAQRQEAARKARAQRAAASRRRSAAVSASRPATGSSGTPPAAATPSAPTPGASSSAPSSAASPAPTPSRSSSSAPSPSRGSSSPKSSGSAKGSGSASSGSNDYVLPPAPAPAAAE